MDQGSARHRKVMRQLNDERDEIKRTAKNQMRKIVSTNVEDGLYPMEYIMENKLYLPEPPALKQQELKEIELLKQRKEFRQQMHAEDLERTMKREQLKADLQDLISCHDDPQSDDEDFLRQVDYEPRPMSRTRNFVENVQNMIPQYPQPVDPEAEEPMFAKPLPLRERPIPPPSSRQMMSASRRLDPEGDRRAFSDRINARADEILRWTGSGRDAGDGGRRGGEAASDSGRQDVYTRNAVAEGNKAFASEMEKLMKRAEYLLYADEYTQPKTRKIPPNPIKLSARDAYGDDLSDYRPSPPPMLTRRARDPEIDELFQRSSEKMHYKFDPETVKIPTDKRMMVMTGNTVTDMDLDWVRGKASNISKFSEEEESLSPIQRQIRATRMAVDKSMEHYRDKTSTISFADGITYDMEDKGRPEGFGTIAQSAWSEIETEYKLSTKPRPDPPESATSWRQKRQEEAAQPKRHSPLPKTEADDLVDEFLGGKLF